MLQAKLSSKFQLSIPKALRSSLNLQAGQQFTLVARGRIIELIRLRMRGFVRIQTTGLNGIRNDPD